MTDQVDQNLGRLFAKVKELGEWDNTLIMFPTDNGACSEQPNTTPNIPPAPWKATARSLLAGPTPAIHPSQVQVDRLRGGIRTPFIAHWPV